MQVTLNHSILSKNTNGIYKLRLAESLRMNLAVYLLLKLKVN
jgi:hypothetical protein